MTLQAVPGGDGVPREPEWAALYTDDLDASIAHEHWGIITREMHDAGTLAVGNGHAIKRLVEFRVMFERASRNVAEYGPVIPAPRTETQTANLYWSAMRQADEAIRALEGNLGISPAWRSKAGKVERRAKTARAADSYLKRAT